MSALTTILGAVMMASSLGAKFVGLPRQILENHRRKTAPHSMRWFACLCTLSYTSTSLWCFLKGDWPVGAAAAPGGVIAAFIFWQALRYPDAGLPSRLAH